MVSIDTVYFMVTSYLTYTVILAQPYSVILIPDAMSTS